MEEETRRISTAGRLIVSLVSLLLTTHPNPVGARQSDAPFETLRFKDANGIRHQEYAFRAPLKGFPEAVISLYCANIKLRLYWNVFRDEVKSPLKTGMHLRRLARFTRHLYQDVRAVDKPFNEKQLSVIDKWYGVKLTDKDQEELEKATREPAGDRSSSKGAKGVSLRRKISKYSPTVLVGLYTRWRTMWWLIMSCLFAKYYLWDPALDEFIKLQSSMVMYPEFQLVKLQDVECLPVRFFRRLLDTCKILNPMLNLDFGQLNLDRMWQFKADRSET